MKIEVKKRGSKEFYDEMLYVITYYKKFIKNPRKKAWRYTNYLSLFLIISLSMCGAFVAMYMMDKEWYSLVMVGAFLLMFFFIIVFLVTVKKRIKMYMDDKSDKIIDITKECINYGSDTMNLKMNKEEIAAIVINKYSICVLPKELNKYAISISKDYLDEFLKGAKEEGDESILFLWNWCMSHNHLDYDIYTHLVD